MHCTNCDRENSDGRIICFYCGNRLNDHLPKTQTTVMVYGREKEKPERRRIVLAAAVCIVIFEAGFLSGVFSQRFFGNKETEKTGETSSDEAFAEALPKEDRDFCVTLENEKIYYYDLDGDENPEKISCTYGALDGETGVCVRVFVNDACLVTESRNDASNGNVFLCDFDTDDASKEIYITLSPYRDYLTLAAAYRYIDGEVTEYYRFCATTQVIEKQEVDRLLYAAGDP